MRLNLPLGGDYIPSDPCVSNVSKDGSMAREVFIYVDDVRSLGWCNRDCWNATRYFSSKFHYLFIQKNPRKRKGPDQIKGPWTGSTLHTSYGL